MRRHQYKGDTVKLRYTFRGPTWPVRDNLVPGREYARRIKSWKRVYPTGSTITLQLSPVPIYMVVLVTFEIT